MIPHIPIEYLLFGASCLLLISILASKASSWLGIPALLLFLLIGMLAGSDGPGHIYFNDPFLAQLLGVVALTFILFGGGLDSDWTQLRPALLPGLLLSTLGVLITAILVGWFATLILGFSWLEGLLLGAVVSSTDAAAVFSILRATHVRLKGKLIPLLELESASNDPMAVFLTIGFVHLLTTPTASVFLLIPTFFQQMGIGAVIGYAMGRAMVLVVNHIRLSYEGLYPVLSLSLALFTYAITAALGGSGFLAVYLAGLVMGSRHFIHKQSLIRFHDGLSWLTQIVMFLTLGLLVFPSQLIPIFIAGLLMAGFLILVARPVSVLLSLLFTTMPFREKAFVAWVGLRGAVPIVLATFPLLAGVHQSQLIFNLVFFIVLTSVLLQGTSIPLVARWLKVIAPVSAPPAQRREPEPPQPLRGALVELTIPERSPVVGKQLVDVDVPSEALIVLLKRDHEFLMPGGGTILQAGDTLLVLANPESLERLQRSISFI